MPIHVAFPSGEKRELEESQLRSQWEQGGIPADSMYWKEGMTDWLPIANYLSPYATPQVSPIPPSAERSGQYGYTN
ncbi:MAG TPA: DUF4339 domain-containing protein, partial [Luteolibacter sp.]|nr:DUF4339 domain-containing protein [Luteolibacter sp.]